MLTQEEINELSNMADEITIEYKNELAKLQEKIKVQQENVDDRIDNMMKLYDIKKRALDDDIAFQKKLSDQMLDGIQKRLEIQNKMGKASGASEASISEYF